LIVLLDGLLREAARELQPVAESRKVRVAVAVSVPLRIRADVGVLTSVLFRMLDCAISLAAEHSSLRIEAACEQGDAIVTISWQPGTPPTHTPFSRPELGLLIAQAGWERLGGSYQQSQTDNMRHWTMRIPLTWDLPRPESQHRFLHEGGQP
jgi:signal transduction histidine kinase